MWQSMCQATVHSTITTPTKVSLDSSAYPSSLSHRSSSFIIQSQSSHIVHHHRSSSSLLSELAKKGLNLILVGRNPQKLKDVSSEIQSKFSKTQIKNVVFDLSGDLSVGIKKITEVIEGLDVGVLINNAGISYPYARFFHEVDDGLLNNLIKVNVEGTTKVTRAVLPGMLKRKRGTIVNIGSGVAIVIPSDPLLMNVLRNWVFFL